MKTSEGACPFAYCLVPLVVVEAAAVTLGSIDRRDMGADKKEAVYRPSPSHSAEVAAAVVAVIGQVALLKIAYASSHFDIATPSRPEHEEDTEDAFQNRPPALVAMEYNR